MLPIACGSFDVTITPEAQPIEGGSPTSRMALSKKFSGPLAGAAQGTMIAIGNPGAGEAASYVALDKFEGRLDDLQGGFVLIHRGTMTKTGAADLQVIIAPGSGTGALAGIAGELTITVEDGKHLYALDYLLPETR